MDAIHRSAGKIPQKSKKRLTTKKELNIIAIETMAKGAKMNSIMEIKKATRHELVAYLESWGTACYDDEPTSLLREAAIETFETEGC